MHPTDFGLGIRGLPDATTMLDQMASGSTSALAIVRQHLDRLERDHGRLNAAVQVFRDRALDEARSPRAGPLSGLPVTIKETLGVQGEVITAGSRRMVPIPCGDDSVVVRRLREAGAVILARSNVPELALAGETDNLLFGRTNNPLNPGRTCGGSSGGEATLVGSGSSAMGVGSDLLGSIRIPASFCGIVGFKPASGAVSKEGTWPDLQGFLDTWLAVGPLTRTVRDARLLYNAIAEVALPTPRDPTGLRLILPEPFRLKIHDPCIAAATTRARVALEEAGLKLEERPFGDVTEHFLNLPRLLGYELEAEMHRLLSPPNGKRFSLAREAIDRLRRAPTIYSGLFRILMVMPMVRARRPARVNDIIQTYRQARERYYRMLGQDGILLLPTLGFLAPRHGAMNRQTLRPGVNGALTPTTFCNYMNLPAITIPAWSDRDAASGLVPGVMLACAPGAEARLLDAAAALERGLNGVTPRPTHSRSLSRAS